MIYLIYTTYAVGFNPCVYELESFTDKVKFESRIAQLIKRKAEYPGYDEHTSGVECFTVYKATELTINSKIVVDLDY